MLAKFSTCTRACKCLPGVTSMLVNVIERFGEEPAGGTWHTCVCAVCMCRWHHVWCSHVLVARGGDGVFPVCGGQNLSSRPCGPHGKGAA